MSRILLIEDDEPIIKAIEQKMAEANMTIMVARNGGEGLVQSIASHPDLILLDLIMPVMNGVSMLEKLRQDEWGKNAKVIILTNVADPNRESVCAKLNVKDYTIKSDSELKDLVEITKKRLKE